ncbi:MAG: hypothetical protein L3J24_00650 [Xanthomonadales bacterium]|nr:hypothetical protein [Xanthomonadales bacterium]
MNKFIITSLLALTFYTPAVFADDDTATEKNTTEESVKSEVKKPETKLICRRVKVTGSNRSEKVCRRVNVSESDSKKKSKSKNKG